MSNYSKTVDFAAKDALVTGNANKIVKGTEIDDEFDAIQVAVATKANLNSPTLTGTPLAPTAAVSTSTTQIATTAFVDAIVAAAKLVLYPVGSIYTNAAVSTNPGTLLGFGTWTAFGTGKVMVGIDTADTAFDVLEETGGSKNVTASGTSGATALTAAQTRQGGLSSVRQTSNATASTRAVPLTGESSAVTVDGNSISGAYGLQFTNNATASDSHTHSFSSTDTNLQPYIVVYMWKRTV